MRAPGARAHPHSRGENYERKTGQPITSGSSPLTRGKPSAARVRMTSMGLIPTHAGKTVALRYRTNRPPAHPHSRGENAPPFPPLLRDGGSSPLTRGKHRSIAGDAGRWGLIPTHAGKTPAAKLEETARRAHPHSRGENLHTLVAIAHIPGSSPLTRGKQHLRPHRGPRDGLIPTHAGKTSRRSSTDRDKRAHPHSRGENT